MPKLSKKFAELYPLVRFTKTKSLSRRVSRSKGFPVGMIIEGNLTTGVPAIGKCAGTTSVTRVANAGDADADRWRWFHTSTVNGLRRLRSGALRLTTNNSVYKLEYL